MRTHLYSNLLYPFLPLPLPLLLLSLETISFLSFVRLFLLQFFFLFHNLCKLFRILFRYRIPCRWDNIWNDKRLRKGIICYNSFAYIVAGRSQFAREQIFLVKWQTGELILNSLSEVWERINNILFIHWTIPQGLHKQTRVISRWFLRKQWKIERFLCCMFE